MAQTGFRVLILLLFFLSVRADALPRVYWTDLSDGTINQFANNQVTSAQATDFWLLGQGITHSSSQVYYATFSTGYPSRHIRGLNEDFTNLNEYGFNSSLLFNFLPSRGLAMTPDAKTLYVSTSSGMYRTEWDGTRYDRNYIFSLTKGHGLQLDLVNEKLYWIDSGMALSSHTPVNQLRRSNVDGSNMEDLASVVGGQDLVLDLANQKVYWTDNSHTPTIKRASLDGSAVETVISTGISYVTGLGLDTENGKLYWLDLPAGKIQRSNLDGTSIEDVVSGIGYGLSLAVINDTCEADDAKLGPGICGCGTPDDDTDGDGTLDCQDECPADAAKVVPGQCGCGVVESDRDNDGTCDVSDECIFDPNKTEPGICGCNLADTDSDNDGLANCLDGCAYDENKTEAGICGCNRVDTDSDNDGLADCKDACPLDAEKTTPGPCGCGVADTDSDNDSTPDCMDQCVSDPAKVLAGVCGCGISDADSDADGTPDCNDECPADASKLSAGRCGCGMPDIDANENGLLDCFEDSNANPPAPEVPASPEEAKELSELGLSLARALKGTPSKDAAIQIRSILAEVGDAFKEILSDSQYSNKEKRVMQKMSRQTKRLEKGRAKGKRFRRKTRRVRRSARRLSRLLGKRL